MKRNLTILIALVMVLAVALPVLAACNDDKVVEEISVVNPTQEYTVGDTIDYDNLTIMIKYNDGSSEQKKLSQLKDAKVVEADLSKAGPTFYTIEYKGKTVRINVTVNEGSQHVEELQITAVEWPDFYLNYHEKSTKVEDKESRSDFRVTGETYEVGNVNKFVFKPTATAFDSEGERVNIDNAKTVATVSMKTSKSGSYQAIDKDNLSDYVAIENNAYKFTQEAAGKYFKLVITLDSEAYDLEELATGTETYTVELVVVDGGYNVYDQNGLSVMADLEKVAWSEVWGCDTQLDTEHNTVILKEKAGMEPLWLKDYDDEPLYKYVGNVKTVILHNDIELDPDNMPSMFFWTTSSELYTEVTQSVGSEAAGKIVGSLRNGGMKQGDRRYDNDNYMRVQDVLADGATSVETGIGLNNTRGVFATKQVSISGNYQSITTPDRDTRSTKYNRILQVYAGFDGDLAVNKIEPVTNWNVFQMLQSNRVGADVIAEFTIKNLSATGNHPQDTTEGFKPGGLMFVNSCVASLNFSNVVAEQFCSYVVGDAYHKGVFHIDGGKIVPEGEGTETLTELDVINCKLYDAGSNMVFLWRSNVNVEKCDMVGAGGPLFILCDGNRRISGNPENKDENCGSITIDTASKLQSYANGNESWYSSQGPETAALFNYLNKDIEDQLHSVGKTIAFDNPEAQGSGKYVNVIAIMICEAGSSLFKGDGADMLDVRGTFTQKDGDTVVNHFAMHNPVLVGVRQNPMINFDARRFMPILQAKDNFALFVPANALGAGTPPADMLFKPDMQTPVIMDPTAKAAWEDCSSDKLAIYMSAGPIAGAQYAPYFGLIVDLGDYKQA